MLKKVFVIRSREWDDGIYVYGKRIVYPHKTDKQPNKQATQVELR